VKGYYVMPKLVVVGGQTTRSTRLDIASDWFTPFRHTYLGLAYITSLRQIQDDIKTQVVLSKLLIQHYL
jgi:hypothetical protein